MPGSTASADGKTYDFLQCHFHTPSEHQINGVTYPMELHCVNKLRVGKDSFNQPEYLVVAFLFQMGGDNSFVAKFLERILEAPGKDPVTTEQPDRTRPFSVTDLEAEIRGADLYYFYKGSLTTPPYTETVDWHVLARIFEASPEQIQTINQLEGNNARHVHMLRDRVVGAAR